MRFTFPQFSVSFAERRMVWYGPEAPPPVPATPEATADRPKMDLTALRNNAEVRGKSAGEATKAHEKTLEDLAQKHFDILVKKIKPEEAVKQIQDEFKAEGIQLVNVRLAPDGKTLQVTPAKPLSPTAQELKNLGEELKTQIEALKDPGDPNDKLGNLANKAGAIMAILGTMTKMMEVATKGVKPVEMLTQRMEDVQDPEAEGKKVAAELQKLSGLPPTEAINTQIKTLRTYQAELVKEQAKRTKLVTDNANGKTMKLAGGVISIDFADETAVGQIKNIFEAKKELIQSSAFKTEGKTLNITVPPNFWQSANSPGVIIQAIASMDGRSTAETLNSDITKFKGIELMKNSGLPPATVGLLDTYTIPVAEGGDYPNLELRYSPGEGGWLLNNADAQFTPVARPDKDLYQNAPTGSAKEKANTLIKAILALNPQK